MGVLATTMTELAAQSPDIKTVMINVEPVVRHRSENHWRGPVKAHRRASSLAVQKRGPMMTPSAAG